MLLNAVKPDFLKVLHFYFSSWFFVTIFALTMTFIPDQYAYSASTMTTESKMLSLMWNPPVGDVDHYRLEISKTDFMNEQSSVHVSHAYTKLNQFQVELEEGFTYDVRIQSVNSYGLCSGFSEKITFSFDDIHVPSTQISSHENFPQNFTLFQNKPNPFNPTTTITYFLPDESYVKLFVYNISGQKVSELQDGFCEAGSHSVVWDASGMPSGVYVYSIISDRIQESKKMLLVK